MTAGGEAPRAAGPLSPHLGFAGIKLVISAEAKRDRVSLEESWQSSGIHHPLWSHQKLSTFINTFLGAPERGLLSEQGTCRGIDREGSLSALCVTAQMLHPSGSLLSPSVLVPLPWHQTPNTGIGCCHSDLVALTNRLWVDPRSYLLCSCRDKGFLWN